MINRILWNKITESKKEKKGVVKTSFDFRSVEYNIYI
jgi:hypothetical protein